jgi:hypothetical protein
MDEWNLADWSFDAQKNKATHADILSKSREVSQVLRHTTIITLQELYAFIWYVPLSIRSMLFLVSCDTEHNMTSALNIHNVHRPDS